MRYVKMLVLLALFFVVMVMFAQNMEALSATLGLHLDLFGNAIFGFESPIYVFVLGGFVLGGILCTLYFLCEKIRLTRELSAANKKIASLEQEVTSLRNLPLTDSTAPAQAATETEAKEEE